jgi:hypothetical protein
VVLLTKLAVEPLVIVPGCFAGDLMHLVALNITVTLGSFLLYKDLFYNVMAFENSYKSCDFGQVHMMQSK